MNALPTSMCEGSMCLPGTYGGKSRALYPLELELGMIASCCMGAEDQTKDLWRSSQCSLPEHLSSPSSCYILKHDY